VCVCVCVCQEGQRRHGTSPPPPSQTHLPLDALVLLGAPRQRLEVGCHKRVVRLVVRVLVLGVGGVVDDLLPDRPDSGRRRQLQCACVRPGSRG
jgi:hypothetical protein